MPVNSPSLAPDPRLLDWLYGTQQIGIKLGLENTQKLLSALQLPAPEQQFIHVAGTNGKGSVCAFIHSIMKAAGMSCGLFTSPHLIHFHERIQDQQRMIQQGELEVGLGQLRSLVQTWEPHPTFFELTLALALDWFRQRKNDWVVLETGLGGRLDATNIIQPKVTILTAIGMDHTQLLGRTLKEIAQEKAGIIKPGVPVVTVKQAPEAMEVISRVARERGASLLVVTTPLRGYELGLVGQHQIWNATMAVSALKAAGLRLTDTAIRQGLKQVHWPARFQALDPGQGRVILDGAHNIDSCEQLVRTWIQKYPGEKATLVFGAVADKDVKALIRALQPIAARWHFTHFQSPRACEAQHLADLQRSTFGTALQIHTHSSPAAALAAAQAHPQRVLITGSLYLAGEVLAQQQGHSAAFLPSTQ
jgi:dihydrofolate synthase / folylpolyglutamate synthase